MRLIVTGAFRHGRAECGRRKRKEAAAGRYETGIQIFGVFLRKQHAEFALLATAEFDLFRHQAVQLDKLGLVRFEAQRFAVL
jgi:hypothetical protein